MKISCNIGTSDVSANLGMEIWIDQHKIFDQTINTTNIPFVHELPDDEADHELRFVMKNKTSDHTTIDSEGNIITDACLTIDNLSFEEIELNYAFIKLSKYTHDFNGTADQIEQQFYGSMGCNGTVRIKFATPIYLWLLENM